MRLAEKVRPEKRRKGRMNKGGGIECGQKKGLFFALRSYGAKVDKRKIREKCLGGKTGK